ncbi:MAG: hypothetical protein CL816_01160 [Coxiellaceae bacterium]|nr:hypothetical protein [Coxiellaceae bacterium]
MGAFPMFAKSKSLQSVSEPSSSISVSSVWVTQLALSHLHWYESRVFFLGVCLELMKNGIQLKLGKVKTIPQLVKKMTSERYGRRIRYGSECLAPTQWIMTFWRENIYPKLVIITILYDAVLDFDPELLRTIQTELDLSDDTRNAFLLVLLASTLFDQSDLGHLESSDDIKTTMIGAYDEFCMMLIHHNYALNIFAGGIIKGDDLKDAWFTTSVEKRLDFSCADLAFRESVVWPMLDHRQVYPALYVHVKIIINTMEILKIMDNIHVLFRPDRTSLKFFSNDAKPADPIHSALEVLKKHKLSKDPYIAYQNLYDLVFREYHHNVIARAFKGEQPRLLNLMRLFDYSMHQPNYPTYVNRFNAYKNDCELEMEVSLPQLK